VYMQCARCSKVKKKAPHWEAFPLPCGTIRPFMSPKNRKYAALLSSGPHLHAYQLGRPRFKVS
jgi:hypothetical protein